MTLMKKLLGVFFQGACNSLWIENVFFRKEEKTKLVCFLQNIIEKKASGKGLHFLG